WFHVREEMARAAAGAAFLKGGDHAAGLAAMQPLASRFDEAGVLQTQTVTILGDLYEAAGQFDQAVKLLRQYEQVRKANGWHASTSLAERYEAALRKTGKAVPRLRLQVRQRYESRGLSTIVPGGGYLWL